MATFRGTRGDDTIDRSGDTGNDVFLLWQGGNDTVTGGSGNDIFHMGAALNAGDKLDGGAGKNFIILNGDYSAGLVFNADTITNIDVMGLDAGHSYNLTMNDGNVAAGEMLLVKAGGLGAGNTLTFNGSAETDGRFTIIAGAGNDTLTGGARHDVFYLSNGGNDTAHGGGGTDTFIMGGTFTSGDVIDGGAGNDTVMLNGDYSAGLTFGASTMTGVERLVLQDGAGVVYIFTTDDATVASGATMTVDASTLVLGDFYQFDGSAEQDGHFAFIGGSGDNQLTGGALSDSFDVSHGRHDTIHGGGGDDTINKGGGLSALNNIDGGAGSDTLEINGDYSAGLTLGASTITSIETLKLDDGHSYKLTMNDGNVAAGATLAVDAGALTGANALTFDGSAETNGFFVVTGGAGDDKITGGHTAGTFHLEAGGNDTLTGAAGVTDVIYMGASLTAADTINGGGGAGNNKVILDGDYSAGLVLGAATLTNIETIQFTAGHSYNITLNAGTQTNFSNQYDGSALGAGDSLVIDASAYFASANTKFIGGAGDDVITANGGARIDISFGGNDTVHCAASDMIQAGATLTAADTIVGNSNVRLILDGDYSAGVTLTNVSNIAFLELANAHDYNITTSDATVASGATLQVIGTAAHAFTLDASAETDGFFHISGGTGDDTVKFAGNLVASDTFTGGAGTDTLELNGDYSSSHAYTFAINQLAGIETLKLDGGHNYQLTWDDTDLAAGQTLTVDGSAMTGSDGLDFDGGTETDGNFHVIVGAGGSGFFLAGGSGNDTFDLTHLPSAASSFLESGDGDDTILFGANFNNITFITFTCGNGNDTIELNGDYSSLSFGLNVSSVETFRFDGGHSYGNVQVSESIASVTVDASQVSTLFHLTFGNSDATVEVGSGGMDANPLDATAHDDTFVVTSEAALTASAIDAGAGTDTLELNGDFSTPMDILQANVANIENLTLVGGANSYDIAVGDGISSTLTVDASTAASLTFVATSDATTTFVVTGSAGNDTIAGGTLDDTLIGGLGGDTLTGGGGADVFSYSSAGDSNTATGYDTITDLTTTNSIHIADGIPTYFGGFNETSYQGSLDADIANQLSAMPAGEYGAVLLTGAGDPLAGHLFLVIDGDNTAGYTPGADYVIDITSFTSDPSLIHFT